MLRKLTFLISAFVLLSADGVAQTESRGCPSQQEWRSQAIKRMSAEAARLGLQVQGDYAFQWDGKVSLAAVQVAAAGDRVRPAPKGAAKSDTLVYVESEKPSDVPNGLYFVRIAPELKRAMAEKFGDGPGALDSQSVRLVGADGRETKELTGPVMSYQLPYPRFRHYWVRISVNGGSFWVDEGP
jgi:hypothetical protein